MKNVILVGAAVLALAVPAFAQSKPKAKSSSATTDRTFVMEAARGGMAEVELGKLAADKAANDDVRKFGRRMEDDHGKANDELKTVAENKHIEWPGSVSAKDKALMARLSKLSGERFDRAYMQAMVNDHVADVNLFKRQSSRGKDPDIKAFASKTLPTLQDHLTMARNTHKEVVGTTGTKH